MIVKTRDAVLGKPGPLTDGEWALIKDHPAIGEEIVLPVESMRGVANIIRHHQERWGGTGYPDRLQKETIPLDARILAVAVAYYAMMSARPYEDKMNSVEAESVLNRQAGTQFDPNVVEAFTHIEVRNPRTGAWTDLDEAAKDRLQASSSRPNLRHKARQPSPSLPLVQGPGQHQAPEGSAAER